VTTMLAWWRSRSRRLTAVVCSGRNRPRWSNGQRLAIPGGAAFAGGGDEPEQPLGAGVVEGGEPDFVEEDEVVAEQGFDHFPDAVVGQAAVEGVGQGGCGEVADLAPGPDGGDAEGDQDVALAGAGRPDRAQVLRGGDPFQGGEVVQGGGCQRRRRGHDRPPIA
jgi:hypothetical protein